MKSFTFLILLLIPTLVYSQLNSGGHPDGDGGPRDIPENVFFQLLLRHNKIIERSSNQWNQCFKNAQIEFKSLNEIYVQLIWTDLKSESFSKNCEINPIVRSEVECFFQDEVLKNEFKHLIRSKYSKSFLKFREGDESSDELIQYFESKIKTVE
jgi:hypothetical protein